MGLVAATVMLEVVTHYDPDALPALKDRLALTWPSLTNFQWYRLLTSPFIPANSGFAAAGVGISVLSVPLAEWSLGTRRVVVAFFAGDWLSTLPALVALRIAAGEGSEHARRLLAEPDSGSSSGSLACLAALVIALPRWPRLVSAVVFIAILAGRMVWWHRLYDFQHAAAAVAAATIALATTRMRNRGLTRRAAAAASGPDS